MPTKIEKDALSGQDTTGHEWDGVKELNTPLPTWWVVHLLRDHRVRGRLLRRSIRRGRGSTATPRACWATRAAAELSHDARRRRPRRARRSSTASADRSLADIRKDPELLQLRHGRRPLGLPDQLPAVPRRRRRRQHRLPQPGRRRLAVGRQRSSRSTRPSSTASATPTRSRAQSMMPRFGADGLLTGAAGRGGGRLRAEPVGPRQGHARGREDLPGAVRRLPQAARQGQPGARRAQSHRRHLALRRRPRVDLPVDLLSPTTAACRPGASGWTTRRSRCWRSTSIRWAAALIIDRRSGVSAMDGGYHQNDDPRSRCARARPSSRSMRPASRSTRRPSTGLWRRVKWAVLVVLLGLYYLVPWLRWDRGPGAPEPGHPDRSRRPARLVLRRRDLAAGSLLRHRPADPGRGRRCSSPPRCSAACGAASPARRRYGPTSSCWSSA